MGRARRGGLDDGRGRGRENRFDACETGAVGIVRSAMRVCDVDGAPLVQRKDDEPATIRRRLERQLPPMYEVIDHYADAGVLSAVQGDQPIDEVTADLRRCISSAGRAA